LKLDPGVKTFFFIFKLVPFFCHLLEVMREIDSGGQTVLVPMSGARQDTSAVQNIDNIIDTSPGDAQQLHNVLQIDFLTTRGLSDAGGTVSRMRAKDDIEYDVDKSLLTVTIWMNLWAKVAKL
jgi:hypothetical protein